jgi:fluoride exporter
VSGAVIVLGIALLGGCGAVARHLLDRAVMARNPSAFPLGILIVNVLGSFGVGVLAGIVVGEDAYRLTATAALGSFTTFSTWMFDSERLLEQRRTELALANLLVSLLLGLLAVWAGRELVTHIG